MLAELALLLMPLVPPPLPPAILKGLEGFKLCNIEIRKSVGGGGVTV